MNDATKTGTDQEKLICDAIYQGGLVMITLLLEAGLLITIISLTGIVQKYIESKYPLI